MKEGKSVLCLLLLGYTCFATIEAQETILTKGGNISGSGGSAGYSIGQVAYQTFSGTNGTIAQGVQQPFEISVVTAIEGTEDITLDCIVYPNPAEEFIKLLIKSFDNDNIIFRLYDINGVLLQDKKIENKETEISMKNISSSIYFLKLIKDNKEVKVFKIIKR